MDNFSLRRMPHSAEAEQSVLGSMIIDARCVPEVMEILRAEDFYIAENRHIFETIFSLFNLSRTVDPVVLLDELKVRGIYDESGGKDYLVQLMTVTPTAANVREYAQIVRDRSLMRGLAETAAAIYENATRAEDRSDNLLESAEQGIYALRSSRANRGLVHVSSIIHDTYTELSLAEKRGSGLRGIPTGFDDLDAKLSGLGKSDLVIMACRPGIGKTTIAMNIARNTAEKINQPVAIFALEMSREQLVMRMLSAESAINQTSLHSADLTNEEWDRLAIAAKRLARQPIYIDDTSNNTVSDMKAKCRRLNPAPGLIVIDYIQLMQSGGRAENRALELAEISRGLKIMAKEFNVPVLCCAQLSRALESRADKRPMLSDLRDSGAIEQDADVVMFLYRDDYYNKGSERRNIAECIVGKNRHGETGMIELAFQGQFSLFSSLDKRHDEDDY